MSGSLILGGSRGIGRFLARESLQSGCRTVVVGRNFDPDRLPRLDGAEIVLGDLTQPEVTARALGDDWRAWHRIFWVAGAYWRAPLAQTDADRLRQMTEIHFLAFAGAMANLHRLMAASPPQPGDQLPHLVVIGSTASWRICHHETAYSALKAAQAHLIRGFSRELIGDFPGTKVSLFNSSGLKKPEACRERGLDPWKSMTPEAVAGIVWREAAAQTAPFAELNILRCSDWSMLIQHWASAPESPF